MLLRDLGRHHRWLDFRRAMGLHSSGGGVWVRICGGYEAEAWWPWMLVCFEGKRAPDKNKLEAENRA
ncbi:TPA: hypothetical protein EYP26_02270 [Candidatus Bathyarchaeota archaeon]|nr:hypothetical protein [Candidatus Bathyarchaeota archaeon]